MSLFEHRPHPYAPRNPNDIHQYEHEASSFNTRLAVWITKATASMWTAYLFAALALIGLFGLLGWLNPFTFLLSTWLSQQFIQLVFLPILSVGQSVLNRKQELQADEQFQATLRTFHETDQLVQHMHVQDVEIIQLRLDVAELRTMTEQLLQRRGRVRVRMPVVIEQTTQEKREVQDND